MQPKGGWRWSRGARVAACAAALLAPAGRAGAQSEDSGIWLGGVANGKLPPSWNNDKGSWRLWTDVQLRFGDDASRLSQAMVRPAIGYALGRGWTIWGGYAYVRTEPPYGASNSREHRIWEQASWSGAIGATALSSRTRLEQRFLSTGSETGWRLRELVKASRPLGSKSIWSAVLSDEYFVNLNSTDYGADAGSDRNRFFVGPGIRLSRTVSLEIGYLNQYTFSSDLAKIDHLLSSTVSWSF